MSVIQDDYVKQAEVIRGLPKKKNGFELTTTQLRVLLSLTAQLFDEAQQSANPTLPRQLKERSSTCGSGSSTSPGVKTRLRHSSETRNS